MCSVAKARNLLARYFSFAAESDKSFPLQPREAIPEALGSGKFTFQSLCTANMMRNENVHQELGNNFFFLLSSRAAEQKTFLISTMTFEDCWHRGKQTFRSLFLCRSPLLHLITTSFGAILHRPEADECLLRCIGRHYSNLIWNFPASLSVCRFCLSSVSVRLIEFDSECWKISLMELSTVSHHEKRDWDGCGAVFEH